MASFTFNDVDMADHSLEVMDHDFESSPDLASILMPFDSRDGAQADTGLYIPSERLITCKVTGTSAADFQTNLTAVKRVLNEKIDKEIKIDDISGRYWNARRSTLIRTAGIGLLYADFEIGFLLSDPIGYDNTETDETDTLTSTVSGSDSTTFTPGGSARAYPVVELTATEANDSTVVSLSSAEHEVRVAWAPGGADLAATDVIRFDFTKTAPTVGIQRSGAGAFVQDIANVSGDLDQGWLFPGIVNTVTVWGAFTTAGISIKYRKRYL